VAARRWKVVQPAPAAARRLPDGHPGERERAAQQPSATHLPARACDGSRLGPETFQIAHRSSLYEGEG